MISPVVLELGSHSLKAHFQRAAGDAVEALRFPWSLGHEVYSSGELSPETVAQATHALEELHHRGFKRSSFFAIATGALRDARDPEAVTKVLSASIGVPIRVLSGREEASMLASGYLRQGNEAPALLADLGGGTLELVSISEARRTVLRDSLPLGAVRLLQLGERESGPWDRDLVERQIDSCFQEEAGPWRTDAIHATGGSVKAIATLLGRRVFTPADLGDVDARVALEGPPQALDPARRRVFLPGLLVLKALVAFAEASRLHYTSISVGRTLWERLERRIAASRTRQGKDFIMKNMRLTNVDLDTD